MIARALAYVRYLRAWWDWFCDPTGDMRLDDERFAEDTRDLKAHIAWRKSYDARVAARHPSPRDCPSFDCVVCRALRSVPVLDPTQVGRQAVEGDAILEVVGWLTVSGFADMPRGELQRYACWLLKARGDYERGEVTA